MTRGHHAFGFAWLDWSGRLKMFKRRGRIVDHLDTLDQLSEARFLIGHCRWATQGDPADNGNNHPHPADGGWIVHNGMIGGYADLIRRHGLAPSTDCDSELLGLLLERGQGSIVSRCVSATRTVTRSPLVMLGLWSRPARLVVVRAGNPLHVGECKGGERFYLASLEKGLPGRVSEVPDYSTMDFTSAGVNERPFSERKAVEHGWF